MASKDPGFTLVELLVVISIIVTLLALLTPAMDKAVYQAELALCGSQMNAVADGQTLYAFDNNRRYMYRKAGQVNTFVWLLKGAKAFAAADADVDDRPIHEGYVDLDWLYDPLAEKVDPKLHPGEIEDPQETVYANYALWYGWGFRQPNDGPEFKAMKRMGDRWAVPDNHDGPRKLIPVPWLVSDTNLLNRNGNAMSSHPDESGLLVNNFEQSGDWHYGNMTMDAGFNAALPVTYSFWQKLGAPFGHGTLDLNFASADGSVQRLADVRNNDANNTDERIVHAPNQRNAGSWGVWNQVAR